MTADPISKIETLRAYAVIFASPRRGIDNVVRAPTEACLAAAEALKFQADWLEEAHATERG